MGVEGVNIWASLEGNCCPVSSFSLPKWGLESELFGVYGFKHNYRFKFERKKFAVKDL